MISTTSTIVSGARNTALAFILRLGGRLPFLLIAGWLYGVSPMGRFAYATWAAELVGVLATVGLRHGLTAHLTAALDKNRAACEGLALGLVAALFSALVLMKHPGLMFPYGARSIGERLFPLIIIALVASDILLVSLAYTHNLKPQITARALVEPWVLTIFALGFAYTRYKADGLLIAYVLSQLAATAVFVQAFRASFKPVMVSVADVFRLMMNSLTLWAADAVELGQRRVDVLILGQLATPHAVGLYYTAFQVATLVQKMRLSVEPIMAPVMAKLTQDQDKKAAAIQLDQVRFWLFSIQLGIVLALATQAHVIMGLIGPSFAEGAIVMILMLVAELLWGSFGIAEIPLLYATPHRNLLIGFAAIVLETSVALVLVPRYGAMGAAIALISAFALAAIWKTLATAKLLGAKPHFQRFIWPLIAGALGLLVSLSVSHFVNDLSGAILSLLCFIGFYAGTLWFLGYNAEDKQLFRRLT